MAMKILLLDTELTWAAGFWPYMCSIKKAQWSQTLESFKEQYV